MDKTAHRQGLEAMGMAAWSDWALRMQALMEVPAPATAVEGGLPHYRALLRDVHALHAQWMESAADMYRLMDPNLPWHWLGMGGGETEEPVAAQVQSPAMARPAAFPMPQVRAVEQQFSEFVRQPVVPQNQHRVFSFPEVSAAEAPKEIRIQRLSDFAAAAGTFGKKGAPTGAGTQEIQNEALVQPNAEFPHTMQNATQHPNTPKHSAPPVMLKRTPRVERRGVGLAPPPVMLKASLQPFAQANLKSAHQEVPLLDEFLGLEEVGKPMSTPDFRFLRSGRAFARPAVEMTEAEAAEHKRAAVQMGTQRPFQGDSFAVPNMQHPAVLQGHDQGPTTQLELPQHPTHGGANALHFPQPIQKPRANPTPRAEESFAPVGDTPFALEDIMDALSEQLEREYRRYYGI